VRNPGVFLRFVGHAQFNYGQIPAIPFRVCPGALVKITLQHSLPNEPIDGDFRVESDGFVDLLRSYHKIMLKDLTLEDAGKAIEASLQKVVRNSGATVTLAAWKVDQMASEIPSASELLDAYIRDEVAIDLPDLSRLHDPETVKKLARSDTQRRSLLQLMAEEQVRQWFVGRWENSTEILALSQAERTSKVAAFDRWCEERRKEIARQVKTVLTPKQLEEVNSGPSR